ncbi:hypothetical protein V8E36_004702 [Tilletia maclaganii]
MAPGRAAARKKINYSEDADGSDFEDASSDGSDQRRPSRATRTSQRERKPTRQLDENAVEDDNTQESVASAPPQRSSSSGTRLKLKLKPPNNAEAASRPRSTRNSLSASGPVASSVHEDEDGHRDADGEPDLPQDAGMSAINFEDDGDEKVGRSGRRSRTTVNYRDNDDDSEEEGPVNKSRARKPKKEDDSDFNDTDEHDNADFGSRRTKSKRFASQTERRSAKVKQLARKKKGSRDDTDFVNDDEEDEEEDDLDLDLGGDGSDDAAFAPASQGTSYGLRQRKPVNYTLPVPDPTGKNMADDFSGDTWGFARKGPITFVDDTPKKRGPRKKGGWNGLPATMSGKDYAKLFGDGPDSSDDDMPTARRVLGAGLGGGSMLGGLPTSVSGLLGGAGGLGGFGGIGGGPGAVDKDAQLGRIKPGSTANADVDPFGPNMQVDFSSIGGLDSHVQQLKEMVSLPLLYPELFTRFKVTPPRGVLFHGPPGTGKTLVARALAASCSTEGQQISFFMRKGADCLSKWVGEAERQLRLLFEEAKNAQPSIIFFDEIDGLAPVRSSKQDQIHASIVSTLLALMDGMDGRGQVVVIGATNRPDSVDPALRRPGRFDREFYFPLPDRKARREILNIHTRGWEPPLSDDFKDRLAEVTKGYGGADLRALCTEAALNAIQRRYPQIYSTNDRLVLQPETIHVDAKDFMMSVNKVVPSSKRAGTGSAAALPEHFQPLLGSTVAEATQIVDAIMPPVSKRNALEEAMYEDEAPADASAAGPSSSSAFGHGAATARAHDGGFGRELLLQSFETLRVFKPRVLIHGEEGMGQGVIGAAILHHLEGYHVQPLDIATLLGDSSRTPEAAVIQIFQEAKRHKPSIMYIPGMIHWANSVPDGVRTTLKSLLDSLSPSDPVMLLAVAEGSIDDLRRDVRSWFGILKHNKFEIPLPSPFQREAFFADVLDYASRPPTDFPDGVPRKKRVLEQLPIAPPQTKKELSKAELDQLQTQDERILEHLKFRLSPVLAELRKKFKRFCRDARLEYNLQNLMSRFDFDPPSGGKVVVHLIYNQPIKGVRGAQLLSPARPALPIPVEGAQAQPPLTDIAAGQQAQVGIGGPAVGLGQALPASQMTLASADGDVSMLDAGAAVAPVQALPPALAVTASLLAEDAPPSTPMRPGQDSQSLQVPVDGNGPISAATNAPAPPNDAFRRDMTIWLLSLDKMHTRLFNSYYLTAEEFLDDVQKLVSNAEEAAEVDEDRVTKAYEMRTLALILIEQFVDPAFRVECAKTAKRVRDREATAAAAAKASKEKGKEAETGAASASNGTGTDAGAPAALTAPDAISNAGALKRAREGDSNDVAEDSDEAARKRQRQTPPPGSQTANGSTSTPSRAIPGPSSRGNGPMGVGSLLNGANVTRSPAKALPRFELDPNALKALAVHMVGVSVHFNIDQLEQLRAAAFNVVWRRRSDWNRTQLIQELWELTDQIGDAVREESLLEQQ